MITRNKNYSPCFVKKGVGCQCRRHEFEVHKYRKIPNATGQLSPWATTTKACTVEPTLHNKRNTALRSPLRTDLGKHKTARQLGPVQPKIKIIFKKGGGKIWGHLMASNDRRYEFQPQKRPELKLC